MKRIYAVSALFFLIMFAVVLLIPTRHILHAQQYAFCASSATAPACQSASYGAVTIAASAQTVVVNTAAVTASSPINLTYDQSLGTLLSVTCNTTGQALEISARSPGSSFTVKALTGTFSANPGCLTFQVLPQ